MCCVTCDPNEYNVLANQQRHTEARETMQAIHLHHPRNKNRANSSAVHVATAWAGVHVSYAFGVIQSPPAPQFVKHTDTHMHTRSYAV